ncbi:3-dehydrosphinganine reductase tsc10a [Turnera subulata]|uniref:3-dehydrosphinganine reductase tsc10a n=1 Tax=Turnera subulata TaxID=218843 RepID=A0A9Q0JQ22_9ROSI|nr:3-dehydrosphinganine reductase tsc10a [Turnera subulata]
MSVGGCVASLPLLPPPPPPALSHRPSLPPRQAPPRETPIKNRHVFVTGGSSGIGLALALAHRAASEGASCVSILARSADKLEEAKRAIQLASGVDVEVFPADLGERASMI